MTVFYKDPGVADTFGIDWLDELVPVMERDEIYAIGVVHRPPRANGFYYECTRGGRTSAREPKLSAIEDVAAYDGSVQWTARHPDSAAIPSITSSTWDVPSGLALDSQSDQNTKSLVTLSSGTAGESYDVPCHMVASNSREFEQTITITVAEQDMTP